MESHKTVSASCPHLYFWPKVLPLASPHSSWGTSLAKDGHGSLVLLSNQAVPFSSPPVHVIRGFVLGFLHSHGHGGLCFSFPLLAVRKQLQLQETCSLSLPACLFSLWFGGWGELGPLRKPFWYFLKIWFCNVAPKQLIGMSLPDVTSGPAPPPW